MKKVLLSIALISTFLVTGFIPGSARAAVTETITYEVINKCTSGFPDFHVRLKALSNGYSQVYQFDVAPGQTSGKVNIPSIKYQIIAWIDGGSFLYGPVDRGPFPGWNAGSFSNGYCPTPTAVIPAEPPTYYFANNCSGAGGSTWHWVFENLNSGEVTEITIPVGSSKTGDIPIGTYLVSDWDEAGIIKNDPTLRYIDGQRLQFRVNRCPDMPPLSDAPKP